MSYGDTPCEIACEVIHQTKDAVLIFDGGKKAWIPRSHIDEIRESSIVIPEWLAMEKELI